MFNINFNDRPKQKVSFLNISESKHQVQRSRVGAHDKGIIQDQRGSGDNDAEP